MSYEYFYSGAGSSLDPNYGSFKKYNGNYTGYRAMIDTVGAPTSIQTANQIDEVSKLLNQGIKTVELQPIQPEVFDQIPKQQFKEINRLTKLTGVTPTLHAPMVEPSGFTKEGWSEQDRETAERQLKQVMEKAHELSPDGNIPVTIHSSGIPGTEWIMENGVAKEKRISAINQETKQIVGIEKEIKFYPEVGKRVMEVQDQLKLHNDSDWINSVTNLAFYKKEADEVIKRAQAVLAPLISIKNEGHEVDLSKLDAQQQQAFKEVQRAELFLSNVETSFRALYNKAYKYSDDQTRKFLDEQVAKPWKEEREKFNKEVEHGADSLSVADQIIRRSYLIDDTLANLKHIGEVPGLKVPELYKPIEEFARGNAAETLANTALHAYKEYGNNSPIVSVENLYSGMAFSRGEDMKKLVDEARTRFVENAVKQGTSKQEAESAAKKLIGVTWDVGHLNIMKKGGFKDEDVIKETEAIAKYVKHVHLTDNFGFSDSHLVPGMGNVPIKEIMEKLEKAGFKGKEIVEAGGFAQHFKTTPYPYVLEAMGSPIYPQMQAPYWNQIQGTYGSYMSTPLAMFPEQHFSLYGSGFSGLPADLGGQIPGKQSRTSGAPMD